MIIGMALWPDRDAKALSDLAVAVERAGFHAVWWPDHYDLREVSTVMALSLYRTKRIPMGTAVMSFLLRHPAMLGSLFATLSELSGGRVVAGLGPGGYEVRTELKTWAGSPLNATRQAVSILRKLTAGQAAVLEDGAGTFSVDNARLAFEVPPVPIYLAGRGPRMIELAGEVADGVITHGLSRNYLALVFEKVVAGAARADRDPGRCEVVLMSNIAIDTDLDRARDALRPRCLNMVGGEYQESLIPLYGLDPEEVSVLRAAVRARDPRAPKLVTDEMIDAFAFAGPPERIKEQLRELKEAGVRSVILSPGKGVDEKTIMRLGSDLQEMMT